MLSLDEMKKFHDKKIQEVLKLEEDRELSECELLYLQTLTYARAVLEDIKEF